MNHHQSACRAAEQILLTAQQVAEQTQLNVGTIRQEIAEGRLAAYRFGRQYRIKPEDVDAWLESRRVTCAPVIQAVPLPRDPSTDETAFGQVASSLARRRRVSKATAVQHQGAG